MYSPTCTICVDLELLLKSKNGKLSVMVIVIDVCDAVEKYFSWKSNKCEKIVKELYGQD